MKNYIKISILLFCIFSSGFVFQRCNISDFGDTNVNPNATAIPVTSALLTGALVSTGRTFLLQGMYAQYFAESQYTDNSRYARNEFSFASYSGYIYDLENIIINNTEEDKKESALNHGSHNNQIAVARILKVFHISRITDSLGDVPYFEALQGNPSPVYDRQEDIYRDFFAELDEAVRQFDKGQPAKGDILYDGDILRWKKFANTFRLQLALRMSKADPTLGKAQVEAALSAEGGVMESQADDAVLEYPGGIYRNPFFNIYNGGRFYAISNVLTTLLQERNDPRLAVYGAPNPQNEVIGFPYGLPREKAIEFMNQHPDWSLILAPQWRQEDSPLVILSAADSYLARAEAAALGWTGEDAAEMYRRGIQASMEWWQVYDPETFETYMTGPEVALSGTGDLEKIQLQRYLSFFPNGQYAWTIWRRTGMPDLQPTPYAVNTSGQIPRRFVYWSREANLNPEHYQAAVDRLTGGDTMDGRVWWDRR